MDYADVVLGDVVFDEGLGTVGKVKSWTSFGKFVVFLTLFLIADNVTT